MKPPRLVSGDTVAIISPSNTIASRKELAQKACKNFEKATGLKTVFAPNAFAQHYYSAGTPEQRIEDFHWALKNPDIKGILFSVGGSTAVDIVEGLDYDLIKQNPKVIAGISDSSTLLNAINTKTGLITFHGVEYLDFGNEPMGYTYQSLKKAWFEGNVGSFLPNPDWRDFDNLPTSYKGWQTIVPGKAEGILVGGNFRCFTQLYGTEFFRKDFKNTILVMETYKWPKKNIHQALMNLKMWGILDQINGFVMGYCLGSDDPSEDGNDQPMAELVKEIVKDYAFPAIWIGEIGHNIENLVLPIGAKAELDASGLSFSVLENVAES